MRKYGVWYLRSERCNKEITDEKDLASIRHMIKCTSVRRHACANGHGWVLIREAEADIIGRPLFTVTTADRVLGVVFPAVKDDNMDYNIVEQFIDSMQHSDSLVSHTRTALRHEMEKSDRKNAKIRPKSQKDGTMVLTIAGGYKRMQELIPQLNTVLKGHAVHMSVITA